MLSPAFVVAVIFFATSMSSVFHSCHVLAVGSVSFTISSPADSMWIVMRNPTNIRRSMGLSFCM